MVPEPCTGICDLSIGFACFRYCLAFFIIKMIRQASKHCTPLRTKVVLVYICELQNGFHNIIEYCFGINFIARRHVLFSDLCVVTKEYFMSVVMYHGDVLLNFIEYFVFITVDNKGH